MRNVIQKNQARRRNGKAEKARSRGFVLLIVLVVVVILSLSAYTFSELMLSHHESAKLSGMQLQATSLADSGADALLLFLEQSKEVQAEQGGTFDNPQLFRGRVVVADPEPRDRGSFSILAPNLDDEGRVGGIRFGLEDESARLNLNSLLVADAATPNGGRTLLMALPGMSEDVADAILDWIDEDDEPREYGAEVDHYSGLQPAYGPKNGPMESVEELLMVRGVTPQMLFGLDVNRNGMIDPHEQGISFPQGIDNADGLLDRGWSAYVTLFSMERNMNSQGLQRININEPDLQILYDNLKTVFNDEWTNFIILYRQNTVVPATGSTSGSSSGSRNSNSSSSRNANTGQRAKSAADITMDLTKPSKTQFNQVLDLIGAQIQISGSGQTATVNSPFGKDITMMGLYMPTLMDNVTVSKNPSIPGRININQATRQVLLGIPNIKPEVVDEIIKLRSVEQTTENPNRKHETWLLTEALVSLDEMKQLSPFVCAGGDVYRAQIVGYFQGGGAAARAEAVIDSTQTPARLLLWRNISHLGRGYALETLGLDFSE